MAAQQAHTLQQHALGTLGELRAWLGARAAELAPAVPSAAAAPAESQAAYAAWAAQVDAVLRAVARAYPECEKQHEPDPSSEREAESAPPTLPSRGAGRMFSRA